MTSRPGRSTTVGWIWKKNEPAVYQKAKARLGIEMFAHSMRDLERVDAPDAETERIVQTERGRGRREDGHFTCISVEFTLQTMNMFNKRSLEKIQEYTVNAWCWH